MTISKPDYPIPNEWYTWTIHKDDAVWTTYPIGDSSDWYVSWDGNSYGVSGTDINNFSARDLVTVVSDLPTFEAAQVIFKLHQGIKFNECPK